MSKERFQHEWTGVAIFFSPKDDYQPQKDKRRGLTSFIPSFLKQKSLLFYIIMASLIITLIEIIGAFYLQVMLDEYIPSQKISTLGFITLGLIITYVAQQIIAFAKEYLLIILGQRLVIDVILTYIKHIFILPMSFFSTRRTGEITSRFTDANQIIDAVASTIFSIFLDISMVFIVGGVLLIQNVVLFFLALLCVPIYIIIVFAFMKMFGYLNYEVMESNAIMSSSVLRILME
ncbi:hypothetical protein EBA30_10560 [Streptococcus mutans]|nr:hypothetical protein EBA30_10560 [Streptococcus mutans]